MSKKHFYRFYEFYDGLSVLYGILFLGLNRIQQTVRNRYAIGIG